MGMLGGCATFSVGRVVTYPFYFQHSRIHHFALYPLRVAAMTGAMLK
jgi:hypothetical protein